MIAIRVYKNCETHKLLGYSIVNEETMEKTDVDNKFIKQLYKSGNNAISNLELSSNGMRLCNMNPSIRRKWYKRTMDKDIIAEHYCVITAIKNGLISFIADKPDGSTINGNNVTLSDIAISLEIPVEQLRFYNGYISKDEIDKTEINVFDIKTGKYKTILEKQVSSSNNLLGEEWKARILTTNTNGAHVISLQNIKGRQKASIPNIVYHLEKFKGGVNNLTIPLSMKSLGKKCFANLKDLYTVIIKDGIQEIPEGCFESSLIEKIEIPITVKTIQDEAFCNCKSLRGPVVLNASYIGRRAFFNTKISIANLNDTEVLGIESFANNRKLRTVKLHEGLKEIGPGAFRWCTSLEQIVIPGSVEKIGRKAFQSCTKLKKVQIKMGTNKKIAKDSFDNNVAIEYID